MRIIKILVIAIAAIVLVAGISLRVTSSGKKEGPKIVCNAEGTIEASVNVTDEELLSFITASDTQDGDLTAKVVVSRKNFFVEEDTTIITFAVSDSDNNVATLRKKLHFNDYKPPEIILNNDFVFPSGYTFDLAYYVKANDVIDGDISQFVKLISSEFINTVGTYPVNLKVSNSFADSTDITVNAIVTEKYSFNTRIYLSTYITYVDVGAELDYKSFITDIKDKENRRYDIDDVTIDSSAVNTATPGVYDVFYRITRGQGLNEEEISMTRLVVVVKGAE